KFLRAKAKKFSRRFLRIYRPQSEHFRFVIYRSDRFYRIKSVYRELIVWY
ncbi:DUF1661 domain-containing protein, partial [Porphyromonas gulae]